MNKFFQYLLMPMLCIIANFASAANIKDYPRVAVMDFGNKAIMSQGLRQHDITMATEYAIYQLSACGWFDLIDYEQLNSIAQMHKINMSGLIDQGTAVQMGKIAGAQFMVIGNVTGLTTKENIAGIHAYNAKAGNAQHVVSANVTVRIVDIETGRIVAAGIGKGSSTSTITEIGFTKYRNRKVETENIYNSVVNNVSDEYRNSSGYEINDRSYEYEKNMAYLENEKNNTKGEIDNNNVDVKFVSIEGDINEDGQIDEHDFKAIEYYFMHGEKNGHFCEKNADIDGDGEITIKDAWKLREIVNGLYYLTYKHIRGDVDSGDIHGKVDENDVERLKYYLVGNRDKYINILEADLNGDGYITLTDLSILKNIVEKGETQSIMKSVLYHLVPQKYKDYNTTHGIVKVNAEDRNEYNIEDISQKTSNNSMTVNTNENYYDKYENESIQKNNTQSTVSSSNKNIYYERDNINYNIVIGTVEVSDVQVLNAISKAVRDAIYGKTGIMTVLNNGKQLKIKTGF